MRFPERTYIDDNYGVWDDMDDPDMVEFYHQVQKENVEKKCEGCGQMVVLRPEYGFCNICADKRERGWDI